MKDDGVKRALAYFTSTFSSYSGCRQYRENITAAREEVGEGAPEIDKLRFGFNHPGFIDAMTDRVQAALDEIPAERREKTRLIFTAHSIPIAMSSGCEYESQLKESCRSVTEQLGRDSYDLVYQSRSGPPHQPWLEPDICDHLKQLHESGSATDVVVIPIGFTSDHLEVLYDLDTEARQLCDNMGMNMVRAGTVDIHPRFIAMIRKLVEERLSDTPARQSLGALGPCHDICPEACCPSGRPTRPPA
jgi:ferrochelatase